MENFGQCRKRKKGEESEEEEDLESVKKVTKRTTGPNSWVLRPPQVIRGLRRSEKSEEMFHK